MIMQIVEFCLNLVCFILYLNMILYGWVISTYTVVDNIFLTVFFVLMISIFVMALLVEYNDMADLNKPVFIITIIILIILIVFYFIFGSLLLLNLPPYSNYKNNVPGVFYFHFIFTVANIIITSIVIHLLVDNI